MSNVKNLPESNSSVQRNINVHLAKSVDWRADKNEQVIVVVHRTSSDSCCSTETVFDRETALRLIEELSFALRLSLGNE